MQRLVLLFLAISVAACAPVTEQLLRSSTETQRSFQIDQPYQAVFQAILDKGKACFLAVPGDSQYTVVGNRVNRDRIGEVVVAEVFGPKSRNVFLLIDVVAVNNNETKIITYQDSRRAEPYAINMRNWITDPQGSCEYIPQET